MLRGLCSRLDVRYPYLSTMADAARITLAESVPLEERANTLIHQSVNEVSSSLQTRLVEEVKKLQEEGKMIGLQISVMSNGKSMANIAAGVLGTSNPRPVTPSTLFCVFSVSKAVLTIGVLRLLQEGKIGLDDKVAEHWPAFGTNGKSDITIRHILTHQAGLANSFPENATIETLCDFDVMVRFIEGASPGHSPGFMTQYHYLSYAWLCGGLIEQVTGQQYDAYLESILKDDLNLHIGGIPKDLCRNQLAIVTMEKQDQDKDVVKVHQDEEKSENGKEKKEAKHVLTKYRGKEQLLNPSVFNMMKVRQAKIPSANGHASAEALASLFDSILQPVGRVQIEHKASSPPLEAHIVNEAREFQPPPTSLSSEEAKLLSDGMSFGLGFQSHEFIFQDGAKARSIGHSGLGGSLVLALPEAGLSVAIVTNQLSQKSHVRSRLLNCVFEEFGLKPPPSLQLY
mmetsp:Transcript_19337/g.28197  ORF Transcript_19337/g.28197 Transcript_19337/m.28197 type:complete len:456 (+) Transcript_19337:220-1587(+)